MEYVSNIYDDIANKSYNSINVNVMEIDTVVENPLISDDDLQNVEDSDDEPAQEIPESVFKQAISTLTPVRRAVFNMYYIDGFSHKEIAKALDITERGSTSILAKARASVRKAITDYLKATGQ